MTDIPRFGAICRRIVSVGLVGCLCTATPLPAQVPGAPRTLSIDSRYFAEPYSNRAIARFGIEVIELAGLPATLIGSGGGGFGSMLVLFVSTSFFGGAFSLAYHEFGHGTRSAAAGLKPFFGHGNDPSEESVNALLASDDPLDTFFEFYVESLFQQGGGYTITSTSHTLFTPLTLNEMSQSGWSLNIRAGGLNNEMLFTEAIEDHFHRNRGNIGFAMLYVLGKFSAWLQRSGSDMENIRRAYRTIGHDFKGISFDVGGLGALLLSGMTYQLFVEAAHTLQGAPITFEPWTHRGLEIPNTSFYMTRSGLSYKVKSGYRRGAWRFPFAVEHVVEGDRRTELRLGGERGTGRMAFGLAATIGTRVEVEGDVHYQLGERFALSAGYALYDQRNLHGARLIPSLEHGSTYHDLHVRAALVY